MVVKVDTLRATCSKEAVILYNVVNLVPLTVSHADSKAPSRTPIPMHSGFSSPQLTALDTKINPSQNPFLLQRAGPRLSTTHYAEPEIQNAVEESFDDQAYKLPASTFRRTSSKLHKTLLASLKSGEDKLNHKRCQGRLGEDCSQSASSTLKFGPAKWCESFQSGKF